MNACEQQTITIAVPSRAWRPVSPIAILPLLTSSTTIGRAVENPSSGATPHSFRGALDSERSTGLGGDERWALDLAFLALALRDPEGQRPDYQFLLDKELLYVN
jgi:hypothetical protein